MEMQSGSVPHASFECIRKFEMLQVILDRVEGGCRSISVYAHKEKLSFRAATEVSNVFFPDG